MSEWSDDCKSRAIEILPKSLNFLANELSFFLSTITSDLKYTELTSRLHHRVGECSILAEIAENSEVFTLVNTLHSQLKSVYSGINSEGCIFDIHDTLKRITDTVDSLQKGQKENYVISVGNYREES